MKILTKQVLTVVCALVLCGGVVSLESKHKKKAEKAKSAQDRIIRPTIGDLNGSLKTIKPYIDAPFIPEEVARLSDLKEKKNYNIQMQTATLVGNVDRRGGEENPTIYNTVIESRPTVIMNPQIQPATYKSTPDVTNAFNVDSADVHAEMESQKQRLQPGAYSTPIKIQSGSINDPTLTGYETPNFIHKREKQIPQSQAQQLLDPQANLQVEAQKDIQTIMSQFENVQDKNDKITQCMLIINKI
jgi:hypothetical protein